MERGGRRCHLEKESADDWSKNVPQNVFDQDSPILYLMHMGLLGVKKLDSLAMERLFKEAAYGTLIVAAREQGMDVDTVNTLLLAAGESYLYMTELGIERIPARRRRLAESDFPCDAYGHNPRWYARLFARLRSRYACEYRNLETILKQAGCPHPVKKDSAGLSVADYIQSVLPKRAEYLAIDISQGARAREFPIAYIDRASGEQMSRSADKSKTLLFRLVHSGPGKRDAYIGVFTLTCGQMANIVGNVKRSDPWKQWNFSIDVDRCLMPTQVDMPWTPRKDLFDALGIDVILASLIAKTRIASFDIPDRFLWERACRAGTASLYNNGSNKASDCQELGWTGVNSGCVPHPVGRRCPNAYGLYDMHGNVGECCWWRSSDCLEYGYMGGSFMTLPHECTSASLRMYPGSGNVMGIRLAIYLS